METDRPVVGGQAVAQSGASPAGSGDDGADSPAGAGRRRWPWIAVKIAVSALLLWFLFATYDISDAMGRLGRLVPGFLFLAVAAEMVSIVLATWRWVLILRAINIGLDFLKALPIVFIALFFNQILPSNLGGDVMRVWRLFQHGSDLVNAIGSVILDRVVALLGLVILVSACLPFVSLLTDDPVLPRVLMAIIAATLGGLAFLMVFERALPWMQRFLPPAVLKNLSAVAHDARKYFLNPAASVPGTAISVVNHVVTVTVFFALAQALRIDIGFGECLVLIPPVVLLSMLPISLAGWGVREGAMVAALGFVGVPPAQALALSITFGILYAVTSLPGAVIWFASGNRKSR